MLLVALCVTILQKLEFYQYHLRKAHKKSELEGESDAMGGTTEALLSGSQSETEMLLAAQNPTTFSILKKIWSGALNVFITFVITLSLFPGFTGEFRNYDPKLKNPGDFIGNLIAIFQLCDFIGRTIPRWFLFPSRRFLWIVVLSRLIFYPLFMILIYTNLFSSPGNALGYVVMIFFALSNGYWSTVGMVYGPQGLSPKEQETGGFLMGFALQFGVFIGVHLAIILLFIAGVPQGV